LFMFNNSCPDATLALSGGLRVGYDNTQS